MTTATAQQTSPRQLALYRAALALFVALTVPLLTIAIPVVVELAEYGGRPSAEQALTTVGLIAAWWGSFVAVWVAEVRLHAGRRRSTLQH
jgi:hypothetical protein